MALTARNKWIKRIGITVLVLGLAVGGLHFYFSRHAARYLESVVASQSGGKLQLQVKGFSFNYFTGYIEVRNGSLLSLDTVSKPATYNIRLQKLSLYLQSFWPLLLQRKLLLDSIKVHNPQVSVYRWRKDSALLQNRDYVSLPSELGRLYQSLTEGLDALGLKRITVEGGSFILYNKMRPERPPVRISGVDFSLLYLDDDSKNKQAKKNVSLHIPAQAFDLPDGRHRLSFRRLHLELFRQRLQLDSCIISTINKQQGKTKFSLFFDQLLLTGVDFDALYRLNKIKADSVYCAGPQFAIEVTRGMRKDSLRERPNTQEIISDFTSDLELAYVGVKSAGFDIQLNGKKKRTLSNAQRDDFSIRGLRMKPDSSMPFTVQQFDMKVRGYELYNEDSSAAYRFDSVQIRNDKVVLRQFSAISIGANTKTKNEIRYQVPFFELEGLDWYALILEERLLAQSASLYSPDIYLRVHKPVRSRSKQRFFDFLQSAGDLLSLQKIQVFNGRLHLLPNSRTEIKLEGAAVSLETNNLLSATSEAGIRSSVGQLSFGKGTVRTANTQLELDGMHYDENTGNVQAHMLALATKGVRAKLQQVSLDDLIFNQASSDVFIKGLQWKRGDVSVKQIAKTAGQSSISAGFMLQNLQGQNTTLHIENNGLELHTFLQRFEATELGNVGGKNIVRDLAFTGDTLRLKKEDLFITSGAYFLNKTNDFLLQDVDMHQTKLRDSLVLQLPVAKGVLNIEALLEGKIHLPQLQLEQPYWQWTKHKQERAAVKTFPSLRIDQLSISKPHGQFYLITEKDSLRQFNLSAAANAHITAQNIAMADSSFSIKKIYFKSGPLHFSLPNGNKIGTDSGSIFLTASAISNSTQNGETAWAALLDSLQITNPGAFSFGKKASRLAMQEIRAGGIPLNNKLFKLKEHWVMQSPAAWLRTGTGTYSDSNTVMHWTAARYNAAAQQLSLDSLSVAPLVSRDSFIAASPYQTDYKTFHSGPIVIRGFNQQLFQTDSAFIASTIQVLRPVITVYRDKRPPFKGGTIKPLPVDLIKSLRVPVSVSRVELQDGLVHYTELNERTGQEGTVTLNHVQAVISNIRNRNLRSNDSLLLQLDALLLDSAQLSFRLKESYTDSLAGFRMNLRMKPTTLSFLNPVVAPLTSVNIQSGTVDSLHLQAIGQDYMALGEMHLFYRDLRIKLVNVGDSRRPKILLQAISFLANHFIIRKNNNGRKSLMYFERHRDRSFFNYIVKMTFNGIAAGAGIKKNKKALKQYHKDLEQLNLPYLENETKMEKLVESEPR